MTEPPRHASIDLFPWFFEPLSWKNSTNTHYILSFQLALSLTLYILFLNNFKVTRLYDASPLNTSVCISIETDILLQYQHCGNTSALRKFNHPLHYLICRAYSVWIVLRFSFSCLDLWSNRGTCIACSTSL